MILKLLKLAWGGCGSEGYGSERTLGTGKRRANKHGLSASCWWTNGSTWLIPIEKENVHFTCQRLRTGNNFSATSEINPLLLCVNWIYSVRFDHVLHVYTSTIPKLSARWANWNPIWKISALAIGMRLRFSKRRIRSHGMLWIYFVPTSVWTKVALYCTLEGCASHCFACVLLIPSLICMFCFFILLMYM